MVLFGTLDTLDMPDVLRLLADTRKQGRLRVEGERGEGCLWLDAGMITSAAIGWTRPDLPIDDAVFEILRLQAGSFAFETDPEPQRGEGEGRDINDALDVADAALTEWQELVAIVPSLAHRVHLVPALSYTDVTIDAARWPIIVASADRPAVSDIADRLGLGELSVSRAIADMIELGLAEIHEPTQQPHTTARLA